MKTRIFAATMLLLTVAVGTLSAEPLPPTVGIILYQEGKTGEARTPLNLWNNLTLFTTITWGDKDRDNARGYGAAEQAE